MATSASNVLRRCGGRLMSGGGLMKLPQMLTRQMSELTLPVTPAEGYYRADWDYKGQRKLLPLGLKFPKVAVDCWVAPNATLIGDVVMEDMSTVWYGSVLRGDYNRIFVGFSSHIFDKCVLHVASESPIGLPPHLVIGRYCTIGPYCTLRSCIIEKESLVGERCVVMEGCIVEENSILEPGSVVPPGRRIPTGEVWAGNPARYVRKVTADEKVMFIKFGQGIRVGAQHYLDEFLPYSSAYWELEQLRKKYKVY